MTHQEAVAKAVKLLRLAQSSNPNESALAAGKAQEIIDRFKLGALSADFDPSAAPDEPIKDFSFDPLDLSGKLASWKHRLVMTIAKMNQCSIYCTRTIKGTGYAIVGRPSDAQTVRYLYQWLKNEVERLAACHCTGCGATYANNFRIGAVETVCVRLNAQRQETDKAVQAEAQQQVVTGDSMVLVRINNAIQRREKQMQDVEKWTKDNLRLHKRHSSGGRHDPNARAAGRQAGNSVRMQPTKAYVS